MYGMVNKALQDFIVTRYGAFRWDEIRQRAEMDNEPFVGLSSYPDELTYRLVGAASEVLETPGQELLEAFGEHWTAYAARSGYRELLNSSGEDLTTFLKNLDSLHTRITMSFPGLRPPSFECVEEGNGLLRLHYYSHRHGLAPFVLGVLKGLGEFFNTPVQVSLASSRDQGHDHDEFVIQYR